MSKRVLILTGTTEILRDRGAVLPDHLKAFQESDDNTMTEIYNLTLPSKQRYAQRHGYDFMSMLSFGSASQFGFKETHIGFLRALRAFQMTMLYDVVMWVDADAMITNSDMSVDAFGLDSNHSLYTSFDWQWRNSFSMGNFIIQRTNRLQELFNAFVQVGQLYLEGMGEEQKTLNHIYKASNLSDTIKILDHSYLNGVPKQVETAPCWSGRERVLSPWKEGDFLAHFTGLDNRSRIDIIRNHFSKHL